MNLRFIDWIWHVRGSLPLTPGQSPEDALDRLDPLFRQRGTSYDRTEDTLTFRKKDQPAQDKMAVFDSGGLRIENGEAGPVLRYHLVSQILLFCFLAPLLFLAFAQLTIFIGNNQKPKTEATSKSGKTSSVSKKPEPKKAEVPMNPLDKALGAPAPDKPDKKEADKKDDKPSPTPAYVFAAIFAVLYVIGRILEDRLIKSLFKKRLLGL